jgi:hypothetical protein
MLVRTLLCVLCCIPPPPSLSQIRRRTVPLTATRTSAMNEVLTGIKLIKLYAWEKPFTRVISEHRRREVDSLFRAAWAYTVQTTLR